MAAVAVRIAPAVAEACAAVAAAIASVAAHTVAATVADSDEGVDRLSETFNDRDCVLLYLGWRLE